jgi:hypothetical protein
VTVTLHSPEPLVEALESTAETIMHSGLFNGSCGDGDWYVSGHDYANSEDLTIPTDEVREQLSTTDLEVVLILD